MDMKNGKNDKKHAFSIAEAMVMLVVVSIIMAVSAPLIAKRSVADSKRIFGMNGGNITGALGANQKLLLGKNAPTNADAKLDVNGLLMANQFGVNGNNLEISDRNDNILFSIDNDGATNIPLGIPNFGGNENGTDGYIYLSDISIDVDSDGDGFVDSCNSSVIITGADGKEYNSAASVTYRVPTSCSASGCTYANKIACIHGPAFIPLSGDSAVNTQNGIAARYDVSLIELKKAKADKSARRTGSGSGSSQQTDGDNQGGNSTQQPQQ